jgi:hypothetical protein
MNGQHLEEVDTFKYLGSKFTKNSRSTTEIKTRLAIATSAIAKLGKMEICFPTKMKLFRSLVMPILLYGCESWTMTEETTRGVQSFETRCFRRMLGISLRQKKTKDFMWSQVPSMAGPQEPLLTTVKRKKLLWFGHVTRHN